MTPPADGCYVCHSVQGHCWSGTLPDYYQTVLQAGTGEVHQRLTPVSLQHGFTDRSVLWLLVQGIIFVYDITNGPSFQHLAKWVSDVDEVRPSALSSHAFTLVAPHRSRLVTLLCLLQSQWCPLHEVLSQGHVSLCALVCS